MFEAHKIYFVNLAVLYAQYANSFVLIRFHISCELSSTPQLLASRFLNYSSKWAYHMEYVHTAQGLL